MEWADVPAAIDDWSEKLRPVSLELRKIACEVSPRGEMGYYRKPDEPILAIYGHEAEPRDFVLCKWAAARVAPVRDTPLTLDEISSDGWVKVAYSHSLRRLGELLNFFPGQIVDGVPNAPSPLAAALTTGLIGAGIGWGAGRAIGSLLPERYGRKLRRTGGVVGGALAASPALAWGAVNHANDHSILDSWPLNTEAGADPEFADWLKQGMDELQPKPGPYTAAALALFETEKEASAFTPAPHLDVNINAIGQTLWDLGAPPNLTAMTMGSLYAARQLPDQNADPEVVTGSQLGQLAANAAGDYTQGLLVGAVLNHLVGTPYAASTYGGANAVLGIISEVVPKLFGR